MTSMTWTLCLTAVLFAQVEDARVLQVLRDYETGPPRVLSPVDHHTWSPEQKAHAGDFSQVEIVEGGFQSKQACRLTVTDQFPWNRRDSYRALVIGPDYLPPETDAVRVRVRVKEGEFRLSVGSPTVYFGHSDVNSAVRKVSGSDDWQTLEFSLHHALSRNFRRARFGRESPVIYYTRWIQEPLYLYIHHPSHGEILIDQVELLARGEGQPYPTFKPEEVRTIARFADFGDPDDLKQAFTFFQEPIDLAKPPHTVRPDWRPPKLTHVPSSSESSGVLRIEQQGTEEVCFAGIMAQGSRESNAVAVRLKCEHASIGPEIALDFLVYVAPNEERREFPWADFAPPPAWRERPDLAFDYYLNQDRMRDVNYGFYHTRRAVPNGRWTTLVLPFADFICAYGEQDCKPMFQQQLPLTGEDIIALGLVTPYRQRRHSTIIEIDGVSFVHVPGEPESLRSFWQRRTP